MNARMWLIVVGFVAVSAGFVSAQTATSILPVHEVLFSVNPGTVSPSSALFTDGDLLSERGYVVAKNGYLMRNFRPGESFVAIRYGLDAIIEVRLATDATLAPHYLFSVTNSFPELRLGMVSHGDLLCDTGQVIATNAQLLRNFRPMPIVGNLGLDAVCLPDHRIAVNTAAAPEYWFSIKAGFFDERIGVSIGDGDLLSTTGRVVATNRQLMRNFHPVLITTELPVADYGLDAVFVPQFNPRLAVASTAYMPPEIWFSTTRGWYDAVLKRNISPGDLLSTSGRVVRTNAQLLRRFNVTADLGLDAVFVRVRPMDFNLDGSVDLIDFARFRTCFNGPNRIVSDECADADVDGDGDVDLADFEAFRTNFTGPVAADPTGP